MRFNLVAINETHLFSPEIVAKVGKIETIYCYNPDVAIHCCEITLSYELIPVDFRTERLHELPEGAEKEKLYDDLTEATGGSDIMYVHCSSIDRIPAGNRKFESKNDFEDEEEALDYFRSNQML